MFVPEDRYITIGSINTHYWAEGRGSPVLLLHGMGGSVAGWLTSFSALTSQHRVYALDLIGQGRTDKPDPTSKEYPDFMPFVHDFMTKLKIRSAHVVGHSSPW